MKKRILFVLVSLLICAFVSVAVSADTVETGRCGSNVKWSYDSNGTLTLTGTGDMYSYYEEDFAPWLLYKDEITAISISDGITSIGNYAFYKCNAFLSIEIPSSVTIIGDYAFYDAAGLESIYVPESVIYLGEYAFASCDSLETVTFDESVVIDKYNLGYSVFQACSNLKSVVLSEGITTLYTYMFAGCPALNCITIPSTVTEIADDAFKGCTSLKIFGNSESYAESYAAQNGIPFVSLDKIVKSGTCGENVNYVLDTDGTLTIWGTGAMTSYTKATDVPWYAENTQVKSVVIEAGITAIGDFAFQNCGKMTSVSIPEGVTQIGQNAFIYCKSLEEVVFPKSLTTISKYAFRRCIVMERAVGADNVTTIGASAFADCPALKEVSLGRITTISGHVFSQCESLESITIPDTVTTIEAYAFAGCASLKSISFPASLKTLNFPLVTACGNLLNVYVDENNKYFSTDSYGNLYNKDKSVIVLVAPTKTSVTIPESVVEIGTYAFSYCKNIEELVIPDSVNIIGLNAFYYCTGLKKIDIGNSVTNVRKQAFNFCSSLVDVTLPETVTSIGKYAFYSCTSLKSVTIPAGVTTIYDNTFDLCSGFTIYGRAGSAAEQFAIDNSIPFVVYTVEETPEEETETITWTVSDGVLTISGEGEIPNYTKAENAPWYENCSEITSIVVEDGITSIGDYAFYGLENAESLTVANSVKYVGKHFIRGTAIKSLTLLGVETIGNSAFGAAESLETLTLGECVNNIYGNVFNVGTITVVAPANSYVAKYVEFYDEKYSTSDATLSLVTEGEAQVPVIGFGAAGNNTFWAIYAKSETSWEFVISGTGSMKNFPYVTPKYIELGYTFCPTYYLMLEGTEININSIKVLDGVTSVGNYAFYKCTKATSLTLPETISLIGRGAFHGCSRLSNIMLPEGVTSIGKNAFNGCQRLTTVNIPASVTSIGADIFVKCTPASLTVKTTNTNAINYINQNYGEITIE